MTKRHRWSTTELVKMFEAAKGKCLICRMAIRPGQAWQACHKRALALGGEDVLENMAPGHTRCHTVETATVDVPAISRAKRAYARHIGAEAPTRHKIPKRPPKKPKRQPRPSLPPRPFFVRPAS